MGRRWLCGASVCLYPYVHPTVMLYRFKPHYGDVIMVAMTSQVTSLTIVYSTVYSGTNQREHQSSASLAFVRGIHRLPVNSPHKWPVTRKMFPFDDVIMFVGHHGLYFLLFCGCCYCCTLHRLYAVNALRSSLSWRVCKKQINKDHSYLYILSVGIKFRIWLCDWKASDETKHRHKYMHTIYLRGFL